MAEEVIPLLGGNISQVVRIGQIVRRATTFFLLSGSLLKLSGIR